MESVIGIYDKNTDYADRLAHFINSSKDIGSHALTYDTCMEALAAVKNNRVTVLLADDHEMEEELIDNSKIWILSEDKEYSAESTADRILFKYQSAVAILDTCLGGDSIDKKNSNIIVVYSPASNETGERYAREKAVEYSARGKTLLLSWESFGGFEREITYDNQGQEAFSNGPTISEFLYLARGTEKGLMRFINSIPDRNGYYYLLGTDYYEDLWNYKPEEMHVLFDILQQKGRFDYIVINIGFFSEAIEELIKLSGSFFLVGKKNDYRCKDFMRQMKYSGKQAVLTRVSEVAYG